MDGEGQVVYIEGEYDKDVSHPRDHLGGQGKGLADSLVSLSLQLWILPPLLNTL